MAHGFKEDCYKMGFQDAINKACKWLKEIFQEYENLTDYNPMEDFQKAMKE